MPTLERLDIDALRHVVRTFRDAVRAHAAGLNRLNVYPVPDGDTGTNMSRTLDAVVEAMDDAPSRDLHAICDAISHGSLMGARGNSGVILSQIMRGFAGTVKEDPDVRGERFALALQAASSGADKAVLKPVEGTILTVVRESAASARLAAADGGALVDVVRAAREAGGVALDRTPELLPVLAEAGVVDAGGAGFLLMLDAALHVVDGVPLPAAEAEAEWSSTSGSAAVERIAEVAHRHADVEGELDVSEQRYEVMYFLDLVDDRIEEFKQAWGGIGDSIVVVGGDGLWNCHVHTNDIGAAIESAIALEGRPHRIRVTDLFEEVDEEHARREAELAAQVGPRIETRPGAGLPPVTTAVVAVCTGDGLVELFGQLGVQGVVTGGQTMNPSTAELLDTAEHVHAEQVDGLTAKEVAVVPTRSLPEALAALVVYDPEADLAENVEQMRAAATSVVTGELTRAVRDSTGPTGDIAEGDWIGLTRGEGIVSTSPDIQVAATALLDAIVGDRAELVTVIVGEEADDETTATISGWLREHRGDVAAEVQYGGQPLYPYLFGVE